LFLISSFAIQTPGVAKSTTSMRCVYDNVNRCLVLFALNVVTLGSPVAGFSPQCNWKDSCRPEHLQNIETFVNGS